MKRAGAETALTVEPVDQVQHVREEHVQHARTETSSADWFWEGSVQAAVARHLTSERYTILRVADTRSRETGKDIVASRGGAELWVTVKGYPRGIDRTRPSTQAGHWFKQDCFDLVTWRGQNRDVDLAYALPDFPRYRALATRVVWLQPHLRFAFLWVREDGAVTPEPPSVDVA